MTHSTVKQVFRAVVVTLSITTVFTAGDAQATEKVDKDQAPKELTEAQKEKKEKNQARRTEKEFMKQLVDGEPSAAEIAEYLTVDASRIGATVDHPSSLGVAAIRKLKKMPPEKKRETRKKASPMRKVLSLMRNFFLGPPRRA